jgi:hypothetical protein
MPQVKPVWTEIEEFTQMTEKLVAKYPERFAHVNPEWLVAYESNKEKPQTKAKPYEMVGEPEPMAFTNSKKYFVMFHHGEWEARNEEGKLGQVFSALCRIPEKDPESGKVGPLDYRDQNVMVRTFGPDWQMRNKLPHLLKDDIIFVEIPRTE